MLQERFTKFILDGIRSNWDKPALADYQGESFTYGHAGETIHRLHNFFRASGIQEGDKIALVGKNSARWCMLYLAVTTYGAVIVPIMPDFREDDLHEIINHSDSRMLVTGDPVTEKIKLDRLPAIEAMMKIEDFSGIWFRDPLTASVWEQNMKGPVQIDANSFGFTVVENDKLAVISYTSGTTGSAKGVMLHHNSLAANVRYAQNNMPLNPGDPIVSFLPLAHTFGGAFEFLFPFSLGCQITILTKTPSPQIIMKAFQEIRPALILSVPLVIEKIYKKQIIPVISKPAIKFILVIPLINKLILSKVKKKLTTVFGGRFRELVIGGAPLNHAAERFFKKMKFPYTVGYGMTECGPLISYADWKSIPLHSSGRVIDTLEWKIDSEDQAKEVGEIMVRGENVMLGYYKNEEATKEILDDDGWLHTGDLGLIDKAGFVYIKGRNKSMLLGPSGKNIYPEPIESKFDNLEGVGETLVVQRGEKLIALIYPDQDYVTKEKLTREQLADLFEQHRKTVNSHMPHYIHVHGVEIREEEFLKTPKRNIRRFLYS
ncbi:MAG: AMP-binding protein [Bacteroidales bacterium]